MINETLVNEITANLCNNCHRQGFTNGITVGALTVLIPTFLILLYYFIKSTSFKQEVNENV